MNRIRFLREEKAVKQETLAAALNTNVATLSRMENGKQDLKEDIIIACAKYFNVSADYLLGNSDIRGNTQTKKGVKIPVLGSVPAGIPVQAITDILDYEEITPELAKTGDFFGLRIQGDSMSPRIMDGDTVIVRAQDDVTSGDIAIVLIGGEDATCKRVKKESNGLWLLGLNPAFTPLFFSREDVQVLPVRIIGKVVELRAKF